MARNKLNINLVFRFSAQTGARKIAKKGLDEFAQLIVEDVLVKAVDDTLEEYRGLEGAIHEVIREELENLNRLMVKQIVGRPAEAQGIDGTIDVAQKGGSGGALGRRASLGTRYSFTTPWVPRSKRYLRDKQRIKGHQRWFEYTGHLRQFLASPDQFLGSLGPIQVTLEKMPKTVDSRGVTRVSAGVRAGGQFAPRQTGASRVTSLPETQGRPALTESIIAGRLKVSVLGKLTPTMIPALISGNPDDLASGYESGLTRLLPQAIQDKLNPNPARNKPYRMTVEPYLSWFLSKAVPYAVLRRVGQLRR